MTHPGGTIQVRGGGGGHRTRLYIGKAHLTNRPLLGAVIAYWRNLYEESAAPTTSRASAWTWARCSGPRKDSA